MQDEISAREQEFWDEHVPDLERCVREYERGPEPNTRAMLDALEPLRGARVLDFACGAGVTTAFLAQRGAIVTGIDVSLGSIERARELVARLGLEADFLVGELTGGREAEIGPVQLVVARMTFMRIFDRNVLRFRHGHASRLLGAVDDLLLRCGLGALSFHQVVKIARRRAVAR